METVWWIILLEAYRSDDREILEGQQGKHPAVFVEIK